MRGGEGVELEVMFTPPRESAEMGMAIIVP
jgi:hypothetical protein